MHLVAIACCVPGTLTHPMSVLVGSGMLVRFMSIVDLPLTSYRFCTCTFVVVICTQPLLSRMSGRWILRMHTHGGKLT